MNWATLKQDILETIDKPNDGSLVERAMCESLRFLRSMRFWWNEGNLQVATTAEVEQYDLPDDFLGFIGKVFYSDDSMSGTKFEMSPRTVDWIESSWSVGVEWESTVNTGRPLFYALSSSKLLVSPVPDAEGAIIEGRYLRDLGTPREYYSGSAWSVYAPNTETAISSTFSHAWFTEGYDILKHRTIYTLYDNVYKDQEISQKHLQKYLEFLDRQRSSTNRRKAAREIRAIW